MWCTHCAPHMYGDQWQKFGVEFSMARNLANSSLHQETRFQHACNQLLAFGKMRQQDAKYFLFCAAI
jgi:hypothetical protein